ncbi:Flp family type IVb pilin [Roseovarius sp. D0-M9]|uniref:Flp family type IVb pilin n=1 Tax=Roseovarius sp. D0-M9 TaxID=3127117 RepID=UPI0030100408
MINFIKNFRADEDGAVTVDWVVLTAAVVGLGIAGVAAVKGGVEGLAGTIASDVNDLETGVTATAVPEEG